MIEYEHILIDFQDLSLLEEKALKVQDELLSGDELKITLACDNLEKAIVFGKDNILPVQKHYSLLGSSLFYLLTTKKTDKFSNSLRSQMVLFATHYCLLRYIRETEKGEIALSPSNYAAALKRAYICSNIFDDLLQSEVYSIILNGNHMGNRLINSLLTRLQKTDVKVSCDNITETLFLEQRSRTNICDYDEKENMLVNDFIDKVIAKYESYVLDAIKDDIRYSIIFDNN